MSNVVLLLVVFICVLLAYVSYLLWMQRILRGYIEDFTNAARYNSETLKRLEVLSSDHTRAVQSLEEAVAVKITENQ